MATVTRVERERGAEIGAGDRRIAYRPAELAAMVGMSTKAIYRAVERGELVAAKVANGTRLLIPVEATEDWLVRHAVVPRAAERPREGTGRRPPGRPLGSALQRLGGVAAEK